MNNIKFADFKVLSFNSLHMPPWRLKDLTLEASKPWIFILKALKPQRFFFKALRISLQGSKIYPQSLKASKIYPRALKGQKFQTMCTELLPYILLTCKICIIVLLEMYASHIKYNIKSQAFEHNTSKFMSFLAWEKIFEPSRLWTFKPLRLWG